MKVDRRGPRLQELISQQSVHRQGFTRVCRDVVKAERQIDIVDALHLHVVDAYYIAHLHILVSASQLGSLNEFILTIKCCLPALKQHGFAGAGVESHAHFVASDLDWKHRYMRNHFEFGYLRRFT